jgi:hypothetical protein
VPLHVRSGRIGGGISRGLRTGTASAGSPDRARCSAGALHGRAGRCSRRGRPRRQTDRRRAGKDFRPGTQRSAPFAAWRARHAGCHHSRIGRDHRPANRRAEIANHANAQACLSLHASESGSGVHLFVSSLAPIEPTRFTPWRTAQAAWVTRSLALAGVSTPRFCTRA